VWGTLLAGLIAAISFWSSYHLIAFLIFATYIATALTNEMLVREWRVWPIIGVWIISYTAAWAAYQLFGPNIPADTENEVYLIPSNKPFLSKPCKQPEGSIAILAGTNEFWSDLEGAQINILTLDAKPVVTMRKTERGLQFSVDMFNLERKIVAKINNNKAVLIPKNFGYNSKSEDKSTISLYDDYDKEILHLEYLNKRTVLIRGVFTGPEGTTIVIDKEEILQSIWLGGSQHNCFGDSPGFRFGRHEGGAG
jgi:hypothetical protein